MEEYHDASDGSIDGLIDGSSDGVIEDVKEALVEYPDVFEEDTKPQLHPTQQQPHQRTRAWVAAPITTVRVSVADGGFIQVSPVETNPILKELITRELDNVGVYEKICQKLIPSFDYNPLTHERKLRYRRFVGSPNPEKMEIRLVDGTPVILIVQYDF
jgi:hypothetical protein